MFLTNRGRFAVTALIDMAAQNSHLPVRLVDISSRQNISIKFLEQIFMKLRQANIVKSVKGPGGGYLLVKTAEEIYIADIIDVIGENIKTTRCNENFEKTCTIKGTICMTHHLWAGLDKQIRNYLNNISVRDVIKKNATI